MSADEFEATLRRLPIAIAPIYVHAAVNDDIALFAGDLELVSGERSWSGPGTVAMKFLPEPRIVFAISDTEPIPLQGHKAPLIKWDDGKRSAPVRLTRTQHAIGGRCCASGVVQSYSFGSGPISAVVAHVANCTEFIGSGTRQADGLAFNANRTEVRSADWHIVIDGIAHADDYWETLKQAGGYRMTHVCRIKRLDGATFGIDDAKCIIGNLGRVLSFIRGAWTVPFLPTGFDSAGNKTWESWDNVALDSWRSAHTWMQPTFVETPQRLFPGMMERLGCSVWSEPMKMALEWYINANRRGAGAAGGLMLAQAAFELLAWTYLVVDRRVLSERAFQPGKLGADDRIRSLLAHLGASRSEVPTNLSCIRSEPDFKKWPDAPRALVEVRNLLVHAKPDQKKLQAPERTVMEAWLLSMALLDEAFLRLFGFKGKFLDRAALYAVREI